MPLRHEEDQGYMKTRAIENIVYGMASMLLHMQILKQLSMPIDIYFIDYYTQRDFGVLSR